MSESSTQANDEPQTPPLTTAVGTAETVEESPATVLPESVAGVEPEAPAAAEPAPAPFEAPAAVEEPAAVEAPAAAPPAASAPIPRSVPRPVPRPVAPVKPAVPPAPVVEAARVPDVDAGPPAESFGRVAEDGTVFVRAGDVERSVGSYPGATPDEALSYFARKYDAIAAEVALLEQRVGAGIPAKDATVAIERLRVSVSTINAVGDLPALDSRLDTLTASVAEQRANADRARNAARDEVKTLKTSIVDEAEKLSSSTSWKATGDRYRELFEQWKAAPRLDKRLDDELWKRFSTARSAFDKTRRAHFATLDAERAEAAATKEKLVAAAEKLSGSTDFGATAAAYRDLMTKWKSAGRAGRDEEEALWARFRAAQDTFFAARNNVQTERDAEEKTNLELKETLVVEAEALLPVTDLASARTALRGIGERWEAIGHVPRSDKERIESRLRKVEDAVRGREQDEWKRTNPEGRARAQAAVTLFQTGIAKLEKQAAAAEAAGKAREAAQAKEAIAARQEWLAEAERVLAEFSA